MAASLIMPFLLALLFSLLLEAPVALLARAYGSRKAAAAVVFGGFLAAALAVVGLSASRLFREAERLLLYLSALDIPKAADGLPQAIEEGIAGYGLNLLAAATDLLRATPEFLVSFCVTLFATYYLLAEPELPLRAMCLFAPPRLHKRMAAVYAQTLNAFSAYLRAQAVVVLQTLIISLIGLKILGVDYVLLFGVLIGLLDLLPMLGPGTLLAPWALLAAWQKDTALAFGLLVLLGIIIIGRQITEPRIMGAGLGLHPLAALASGFIGLAAFGAFGLLLGPLLASLAYFVYRENKQEKAGAHKAANIDYEEKKYA